MHQTKDGNYLWWKGKEMQSACYTWEASMDNVLFLNLGSRHMDFCIIYFYVKFLKIEIEVFILRMNSSPPTPPCFRTIVLRVFLQDLQQTLSIYTAKKIWHNLFWEAKSENYPFILINQINCITKTVPPEKQEGWSTNLQQRQQLYIMEKWKSL